MSPSYDEGSEPDRSTAVRVGEHTIGLRTRTHLELPVARLPTNTWLSLPVTVIAGHSPEPRLWLSAALHGDELCGIEIIRRVLASIDPGRLAGTLVAVPVVNVFGLINDSRYLPDRRDLNRSFPGSPRGSLASRLARLFMTEIVTKGSIGIDLHTGAEGRTNLPQIRADLDRPDVLDLAQTFGAPVAIHARTRDGSLREAASKSGATALLYEGGEARRFDPVAIERGVEGIQRVLNRLGMTDGDVVVGTGDTQISRETTWVRARRTGLATLDVDLGDRVTKGQTIGVIRDTGGTTGSRVTASTSGLVIGVATHPLVHQGDAVVHLATLS